MIIWGWRVISKVLKNGTFFCPKEGVDRTYRLKSARRWFTLFFIPLIPLEEQGTYVECATCHQAYDEAVLQLPTLSSRETTFRLGLRAVIATILTDRIGFLASEPQRDMAVTLVSRVFGLPDYSHRTLDTDLTRRQDLIEGDLGDFGPMLNDSGREQILRLCMEIVLAGGPSLEVRIQLVVQVGAALGMSNAHVAGVIQEVLDESKLERASSTQLPVTGSVD